MRPTIALSVLSLVCAVEAATAAAQSSLTGEYAPGECTYCDEWNEPQESFRLFGDTYYVGTRGLTAVLITSDEGHVLIDGGIPASAPLILENIAALGFDIADVALLLNSHAHFDHSGGLAALQAASGARVAASAESAPVLESGESMPGDPQHGGLLAFPAVRVDERITHGQTLRVGPLALTGYVTPGHAPGGTTWTWRSCDGNRCLDFVYADSHSAVSADGFHFSDASNAEYLERFEEGFAVLEQLPCDVVIAPHPSQASFWERLRNRPQGLVDEDGCRQYVEAARVQLQRRLAEERGP
ncbi:MAG: subclass B3 metallo-beta-lactamase [Gemmatimonadota bacterium]